MKETTKAPKKLLVLPTPRRGFLANSWMAGCRAGKTERHDQVRIECYHNANLMAKSWMQSRSPSA